MRIQDAIADGNPERITALGAGDISRANTEQRIAMIDILLDRGSFFQKASVPKIWDSFGKGIVGVANSHAEHWKKSFAVAAGHMRTSKEVRGQETYFIADVESVARGYVDQNEQFCKDELVRLGLTEKGEVAIGPPTAEQTADLKAMQETALKIAADQEAMRDLRRVKVGYQPVRSPPPYGRNVDTDLPDRTPVLFDPEKPPPSAPDEGDADFQPWGEVKKSYDDLDRLVQARLAVNPGLFPLVRGAKEDPTKTKVVAGGSREQALTTIGDGLRETLENIVKTRPMLHVIAPDLEPIHGQLLAGSTSIGGRNWKTAAFYETLGRDIVEQNKPGPWWEKLGLAAANMAVYVVAGLATGGAALAIGLAAKGLVEVGIAKARADVVEAAAKTNVTAETGLVREGQVDEAKADLIMAAAFALIDLVFAGKEVRSVLRVVRQFEEEAAKAAVRAAAAADKAIAKQSAKEAKEAAQEAKTAAAEARAAAEKARAAAATAESAETARATEEFSKGDPSCGNCGTEGN